MKKATWFFSLMALFTGLSLAQSREHSAGASQILPQRTPGEAEKIMGYDIAPRSIDRTEAETAGGAIQYPTNTNLGYKGIVMAEFDSYDENDEIMVDFGSLGLWYYNAGVWTQMSGVNPEGMISATLLNVNDDELVVDFGSLGLWMIWDPATVTWYQLSGVDPDGMFSTDDDNDGRDELHVDFGSLGLWRYDLDNSSWIQLSGLDPLLGLRMDAGYAGYEEGCHMFLTHGVWNIYGSPPVYIQLTGTVTANDDHASAKFTNSAGAEDLIVDFGGLGLWLYKEDLSGWVQASSMSANRVKEVKFAGTQDYELLAEDNVGGLYWGNWNGGGMTWTLITDDDIGPGSAWCETFDIDGNDNGDEEVVIPWAAGGAGLFDYSAGSVLMKNFISSSYFIKYLVKGDYYNRGYDSTLAVVYVAPSPQVGIFLTEPGTGAGNWITHQIPDGLY